MNITMFDLGAHLGSRDTAISLRDLIGGALSRREAIRLDFQSVQTATQSFLDELIGTNIRREGAAAIDLLEFVNCSAGIGAVLRFVFAHSAKHLRKQPPAPSREISQYAI